MIGALLGKKNGGEILIGGGEIGLEVGRQAKCRQGFFIRSNVSECESQIHLQIGALRIEFDGVLEKFDRFFRSPGLKGHDPHQIVGVDVIWMREQNLFADRLGFRGAAGLIVAPAARMRS